MHLARVDAVATHGVPILGDGLTHRYRPNRDGTFQAETVAEYWDAVSSYGVDPSEVHSVSDDDLPDDVTDDD